jgi:hypothetical protein
VCYRFTVYLRTLSVAQSTQRRKMGQSVHSELEKNGEKGIGAEVLSYH